MAVELAALLDDIAAIAKLAAASVDDVGAAAGKATVKAAGVVVDDAAVTPAYVDGLAAERELPIIRRIAIGSVRNKLVFILPAALLLDILAGEPPKRKRPRRFPSEAARQFQKEPDPGESRGQIT